MSVEVIGIDHVFVAVSDLRRSEGFYDRVMPVLGFRKGDGTIGGDPHLFYYNRQFVYSLRPAREGTPDHDPYAPGLHHLCFRVVDEAAVDRAARGLREAGITKGVLPARLSASAGSKCSDKEGSFQRNLSPL